MPIKLITQLQNTSVTNNVEKVTKVYAVFNTDALDLGMVECLKEAKSRTMPFYNVSWKILQNYKNFIKYGGK